MPENDNTYKRSSQRGWYSHLDKRPGPTNTLDKYEGMSLDEMADAMTSSYEGWCEEHPLNYRDTLSQHEQKKYDKMLFMLETEKERRIRTITEEQDRKKKEYEEKKAAHRLPHQSWSTKNGPGAKNALWFFPHKKKGKRPLAKADDFEFPNGDRAHGKVADNLLGARGARFSCTFDSEWKGKKHHQISMFVESPGAYDLKIGFTDMMRNPKGISALDKVKPGKYDQITESLYYSFPDHAEVFYRSFEHIVQTSNMLRNNKLSSVDGFWMFHNTEYFAVKELCRTPINGVKIHFEEEDKPYVTSGDEDEDGNVYQAYEVVELVAQEASPDVLYEKVYREESGMEEYVELRNPSGYVNRVHYDFVIRREYTVNGATLPVSYLRNNTKLYIPHTAVPSLIERIPSYLADLIEAVGDNPSQYESATWYKTNPRERLQRWAFVKPQDYLDVVRLNEVFQPEVEPAFFTSPHLYQDTHRFTESAQILHDDDGFDYPAKVADLDPLYMEKIVALHKGELRWRQEWSVNEQDAWSDASRLDTIVNYIYSVCCWVYVFLPAFLKVFRAERNVHTGTTYVRPSRQALLPNYDQIRLQFGRGPPLL